MKIGQCNIDVLKKSQKCRTMHQTQTHIQDQQGCVSSSSKELTWVPIHLTLHTGTLAGSKTKHTKHLTQVNGTEVVHCSSSWGTWNCCSIQVPSKHKYELSSSSVQFH